MAVQFCFLPSKEEDLLLLHILDSTWCHHDLNFVCSNKCRSIALFFNIFFVLFFKNRCIHLFERQNQMERGRDQEIRREEWRDLPSAGSFLNWLQWPGLGQTEAGSQKHHLSLPHRWQGLKYLGHLTLPSQVH